MRGVRPGSAAVPLSEAPAVVNAESLTGFNGTLKGSYPSEVLIALPSGTQLPVFPTFLPVT